MSDIRKIDTDRNGRISNEEFEQFWRINKSKTESKTGLTLSESKYKGAYAPKMGGDLSGNGDQKAPTDPSQSALLSLVSQLENVNDQAKKDAIMEQIQSQVLKMESEGKGNLVPKSLSMTATPTGEEKKQTSFRAQTLNGGKTSSTFNAASAKAQALELGDGAAKAETFEAPENWGAEILGGGEYANASELLESSLMKEQYTSDAWDDINENTKKGKQLMMLFFYYAKLAESGDMGAIYQFMKFITYVISKDKAKQQIELGKKLIELQELSRQWTNTLINCQTNATDANASSELMKTMTIVKSETDAIATSQKLISQMMEEFAQVVETLTNTTKGALETQGRILRAISVIR